MIPEFQGNYRFLSNFWPCFMTYDSYTFTSLEHAYQYSKFDNQEIRTEIREAPTAADAKRLAKTYNSFVAPSFHIGKRSVMYELLKEKFQNDSLQKQLIQTYPHELQEGNRWGDTFWGVDLRTGKGHNHLGKLLMRVREELIDAICPEIKNK